MPQNKPPYPIDAEVGVVVVAAGSGQRLGHGIPKARVLCGGKTLLEHSLGAVLDSRVATSVVVVLPLDDDVLAAVVERLAGPTGSVDQGNDADPPALRIRSVAGGATRTDSVRAGLAALPDSVSVVLVHDAARALTPPAVFQRVARAVAAGAPAVIPVIPVVDTVKTVAGDVVTATPDRAALRAVQTPQGFDAAILRTAHAGPAASDPGVTDDAMLVEAQDVVVRVVDGDALAFKITTPLDLVIAEAVLAGTAHTRSTRVPQ